MLPDPKKNPKINKREGTIIWNWRVLEECDEDPFYNM